MSLRTNQMLFWGLLVSLSAAAPSTHAAPISFTPLGDLPGDEFFSVPTGISADGKVVVGYSESTNGTEAFRWTSQTGMVGLGDLDGGDFFSRANAISADGSVIVGTSASAANDNEAFRWTEQDAMVGLLNVEDQVRFENALGVSGDGSVIVGFGSFPERAVLWTIADGATSISLIPPFIDYDSARTWDSSDNGSVIVGTARVPNDHPFLVNPGGVVLINIDPAPHQVADINISADGNIVAGTAVSFDGEDEAFRWTEVGGAELLGFPPGAVQSAALDISADGEIIAGYVSDGLDPGDTENAAIWGRVDGWQNIPQILTDATIDTEGWQLLRASAISANGRIVAGAGINPNGDMEGWLAVIEIPEPSAIGLCLFICYFITPIRRPSHL